MAQASDARECITTGANVTLTTEDDLGAPDQQRIRVRSLVPERGTATLIAARHASAIRQVVALARKRGFTCRGAAGDRLAAWR